MTTEVLEIRAGFSHPPKLAEAIGNQNQLRPRPGQSSRKHSFGKRVRGVTVKGQGFIDNGSSTRFVTHVPQRDVMIETKVLKTKSTTLSPRFCTSTVTSSVFIVEKLINPIDKNKAALNG
jgi:hypothetical protein